MDPDNNETGGRGEPITAPREPVSRRGLLGLLGLGGLAALGTSAVAAQAGNGNGGGNAGGAVYNWRQDVDARGHALSNLGSLSMTENDTPITDFEGANLSIDDGGTLNADVAGEPVWEDTDPEDGLLEAPGFDGIDVPTVANTDGTLVLEAGGERALRLEPAESDPASAGNIVAGHPSNSVGDDILGAIIAGGGYSDGGEFDWPNRVLHHFGTVGGGARNTAGAAPPANAAYATVGGGLNNKAGKNSATVGGGLDNVADHDLATIGGGWGNSATGFVSTVAGGQDNTADGGNHPTIAGGRENTASGPISTVGGGSVNTASGGAATVAGGNQNTAGDTDATVSGGRGNVAGHDHATVGGGLDNSALGLGTTVAGGRDNTAENADDATVSGGHSNTVRGQAAVVPGGHQNEADGNYSFAAGQRAKAHHDGAFVWADSNDADFASDGQDTFNVRATGGAQISTDASGSAGVQLAAGGSGWASLSDRNAKGHVEPVDPIDILDRVQGLPISTWNYDSQQPSIRHMGPMAQDFHAAFGLGEDDTHITGVDADGVALAAIQGLTEKLDQKDEQIDRLEQRIETLEHTVNAVHAA